MKAAVIEKFIDGVDNPYTISEIERPKPDGYKLLLKTGAAGYCHTDSMVFQGKFKWWGSKEGLAGSHESVGTIVEKGNLVSDEFEKGMRVGALNFMDPCEKCPDCKAGRFIYCDNMGGAIGLTTNGAFAEYVLVDSRFTVKLPDSMSFEKAAPLTCAGATIWGAIKKCNLQKGDKLGIIGAGALGHIGAQLAKSMDIEVVAIDSREGPLEMLKELPYLPDVICNANDGVDKIKESIEGHIGKTKDGYVGLDAVIVTANPNSAFEMGSALLKKHGLLVVVSQPDDPIQIVFQDYIFRDIHVVGSLLANTQELQDCVNWIEARNIEVKVKSYKLEEVNDVVKHAHSDEMQGKLVVRF